MISGVVKANRVTLTNQRELPASVAADRTSEMGLIWNLKTEGASYGKNRDRTTVDKGSILNKKASKEKMCVCFSVCCKSTVDGVRDPVFKGSDADFWSPQAYPFTHSHTQPHVCTYS